MKPRLVMLHGWAVNSRIWDPILADLQSEFEVTQVDLPGYGSDTDYEGEYLLNSIVNETLARAPEKATWVAWSLGATIAIAAAIEYPERFEKLQLISPTPKFLSNETWELGSESTRFLQLAADFEADFLSGLRKFLLLSAFSNDRSQRLPATKLVRKVAALIRQEKTPSHQTLQSGLEILRDTDLRDHLTDLKVPTQVIVGTDDQIVPPEASRFLFEQLPNPHSFREFHAGHLPFLQSPSEYIETLISFTQDTPQ